MRRIIFASLSQGLIIFASLSQGLSEFSVRDTPHFVVIHDKAQQYEIDYLERLLLNLWIYCLIC
jgi:hypothetical protein